MLGAPRNLPPFFEETTLVNGVVDTPRGASCKLKFDEDSAIFRVHKGMPLGLIFPFNFGYVPSTRGEDGDAVDVLLLADPVFPVGSVVLGQVIGVLEAVQIEGRRKQRNDRLLARPVEVVSRNPILPTMEFNAELKKSIAGFFIKYNELQGRKFQPHGYSSATAAIRLIRRAHATWKTHRDKQD